MKGLRSSSYGQQRSASPQLAHPSTVLQRSRQGHICDGVCYCAAVSLVLLFLKDWTEIRLPGKRKWGSLLLQEVPLYPGAHTHVPSSGEQDPPFWQEQLTEQLGPQKPCGHTLSQWIPAGTLQWRIFSKCTLRRQRLICWNILNSLPSVKTHHQRKHSQCLITLDLRSVIHPAWILNWF